MVLAIVLVGAGPSHAVIIASGDGTGNTTAPADDPGWANLGIPTAGLTAIYLGNGWVLTANHVGAGAVVFQGKTYSRIPGSEHQLVNPDSTPADLLLFQIDGQPPLPYLPIALGPPTTTSIVTLIGNGDDRGAATSWQGINGFFWANNNAMRWGTAPVSQVGIDVSLNGDVTHSFATVFQVGGSAFPAQASLGDSGGAAFVKVGGTSGTWFLTGVLFAIDSYNGQPASTSLYGNHTYAADLSFYRSQIVSLVTPGCGLGIELVPILPLLLWFKRRSAGGRSASALARSIVLRYLGRRR
jgi:hypothetical protein